MRSSVADTLPPKVRRGLANFGFDLGVARKKKRHLTVAMMAERMGVATSTYRRAEQGDPTVSLGVYAMALFVLGLGDAWTNSIDPRSDDQGLLLDLERLPKRVRPTKVIEPL